MKTKLILIALITLTISSCQAQAGATVYAKNSDISDNLDLRAVASIFGESANLQDFERRLNDPKYQISNLDLNGDNEVDYLRVIESVEDRTHVVIIQAVLDRDVYQDIATIDVERNNYNKVSVQVVGNTYLYGANYIYEPVYNVVPVIYNSFWVTNYRPYYSTWGWNYYPTYYTAWTPYPVYRYRNNINICINVNNRYNYVSTRRSYRAPVLYESRRTYGYETRRPDYSFAQRHSNVTNRYDLDQRRVATRETSRNQNSYNTNRSYNTHRTNSERVSSGDYRTSNRNYSENRSSSDRNYNNNNNNNRVSSTNRDNSTSVSTPVRVDNSTRTDNRRNYNENNTNSSRRNYDNRVNTNRTASTQQTEVPRNNSENRTNSGRTYSNTPSQRTEAPRNYSENRGSSARSENTQRSESPRASQESRSSQPQRESGSNSRSNGRRG
ncbi:hypothetical protein [Flavobacterium hibernum]|uniref:Lipoprotein n=1 Tax=Flavobacterium hibernum TaxID=37752 RepID=A0A0D0F8D7_9FLAO|nr:hypothetical protein [Flavobacterium hibernum]KIO54322.1 hypothetical protein IW18_02375 [Flavobacterium hibernum]OXA88213.1 hypothetical protein B0A73_10635 [Flavobacterium hibernum]STO10841.1 Uncharacterised protein [Flavobacterium hibernum]